MRLVLGVLLMSIGVAVLGGCEEEAGMETDNLEGTWQVVEATRNGKQTELVNGAEFVFDEGSMVTDITGFRDSGQYVLEGVNLMHHGRADVPYTVNHITSDSLQLSVVLRGLSFVLDLEKTAE